MVEQSARLHGLKFETEPARGEREMQPVLDGNGRIAGFFTWEKTQPMTAAMGRLMPFIVGVALALVGFAGIVALAIAPRRARTGGERGTGAARRRRRQADRTAQSRQDA